MALPLKSVARQTLEYVIASLSFRNKVRLFDRVLGSLSPDEYERLARERFLLHEDTSLRRVARLGFMPKRIIDVGAYEGDWTRLVKSLWPDARVLMVEPQESKRPHLERTRHRCVGVDYVQALVGKESGAHVPFFEMESGSSVYAERSSVERSVQYRTIQTLDDLVSGVGLGAPDLIKIDVQGAELDVLCGGPASVASAQMIQLELQMLPINEGAPLFAEVVAQLRAWGFVAYDLFTPWRRPLDGALRSIDALFVRSGSPLVSDLRYDAATENPVTL